MLITERFVFIHMHKTGGQTLNSVLKLCMPNHIEIGYHYPYQEIPVDFKELPIVGIVRNPWSWYVSWYAFNRGPQVRSPLFAIVSDFGRHDFSTTIKNLVNLGSNTETSRRHRNQLIERLPDTLDKNNGIGLTKNDIRNLSASNLGYYSWLFQRMFGNYNSPHTYIGKFENLQQDFVDIMSKLAVVQTPKIETELSIMEHKNVSFHNHYSHYYDASLEKLVTSKESELISDFKYQFESVNIHVPTDTNCKFFNPAEFSKFQKLLGRAKNYLKLHDNFDIGAVRSLLNNIPHEKWRESGREKQFEIHRQTEALILVKFEDFRYTPPKTSDLYCQFKEVTQPIVDVIAQYYQDNGFVIRMVFAKLLAGGKILEHQDTGYSLLNCHRIHIPIVSNEKNIFSVEGEKKCMRVGEFWEINNAGLHGVDNNSDEDRIHLIIDWMPNRDRKPLGQAVLPPRPKSDEFTKADISAQLNHMLENAYAMHRAGDIEQAISLYRAVLDFEPKHPLANNLFGLLCLQTKQFHEAIKYIQVALSINPDDPQAHANIGLAYQELRQIERAIHHFQQSLSLAPNNPGPLNNLGNMYKALGQLDKAVECYQNALLVNANHLEAKHNLGSTLLLLGRNTEAVEILKQALVLKPDFKPTQIELEKALQKMRTEN